MWVSYFRSVWESGQFYGYGLAVGVNAKNSYGGYTGEKIWVFHRDAAGTLRHWDPAEWGEGLKWGSPSWAGGKAAPR